MYYFFETHDPVSTGSFVLKIVYRLPFFISLTAWVAALAVRAIYSSDGLWFPVLAIAAPSVTNTFLQ